MEPSRKGASWHQNSVLKPSHLRVRRERLGVICGFVGGCVRYAALAIKVRSALAVGSRLTTSVHADLAFHLNVFINDAGLLVSSDKDLIRAKYLQRRQQTEASKISLTETILPSAATSTAFPRTVYLAIDRKSVMRGVVDNQASSRQNHHLDF